MSPIDIPTPDDAQGQLEALRATKFSGMAWTLLTEDQRKRFRTITCDWEFRTGFVMFYGKQHEPPRGDGHLWILVPVSGRYFKLLDPTNEVACYLNPDEFERDLLDRPEIPKRA